MKCIVAYFSAEGKTERYAKTLAEAVHAEQFAIVPELPYTEADLKWTNPLARCNREKLGKKDVPVQGIIEGWEEFDIVFLGFPIWYYGAPNVINTFCKGYDWTGKKLYLFATSGSSSIGKTVERLLPYLKGNPEIIGAEVYQSMDKLAVDAVKLLG